MKNSNLLSKRQGGVCLLTLNRPDQLNAFDEALAVELNEQLAGLSGDDSVKAIVITGAGRAFCAGEDLGSMDPGKRTSLGDDVRRKYNPMIRAVRKIEKPFIAAINGVAAGAGLGLALACDFRIVAADAIFVQAFCKIGLVPDSGCTMLARLISPTIAYQLMITGEPLNATGALRLGLVNQVAQQPEQLVPQAMKFAEGLSLGPAQAFAMTKRAFNKVVYHDLSEVLEYEAGLQQFAGRTQDFAEGVRAFQEKRPPAYVGR